ncbi:hypothetical protein JTB14_002812 [Gonioctena quinquepunctata]|nr:hypothetical protein JTB14_002812 [Gonioctena quinquepunctata]
MPDFIQHFGIDGIPLHKSTKFSFWPILCRIRDSPDSNIFAVAIFYGPEKPDSDHFLEAFVNELVTLRNEGLNVNNKMIQIQMGSFCCDTPARAFVKNTKSHNGNSGCDKCVDKGVHCNHRMFFLNKMHPFVLTRIFTMMLMKVIIEGEHL